MIGPHDDTPHFGEADRPPTSAEEEAAERGAAGVDPDDVAEHHREMREIGARVDGEGTIDGSM